MMHNQCIHRAAAASRALQCKPSAALLAGDEHRWRLENEDNR